MYEKVKNHLLQSGFKKHSQSSMICVRDEMLFTVSPQDKKNNINVWYAIYPLTLPGLWVNQGWSPAAGSFPLVDGKEVCIPYEEDKVEEAMIHEIEQNVFPFFEKCKSLHELEKLFAQGNFRARYPQAFTLLTMKKFNEGQWMLHELTEAFDTEPWELSEQEVVWKFVKMQTYEEIECALQSERKTNIKKHNLVNYMKMLKRF